MNIIENLWSEIGSDHMKKSLTSALHSSSDFLRGGVEALINSEEPLLNPLVAEELMESQVREQQSSALSFSLG